MFPLEGAGRVLVHPGATDMRLGFWGLSALAGQMREGDAHLFCSADRRTAKALLRAEGSTWLLAKRLDRGRFSWPGVGRVCEIDRGQLRWLLEGMSVALRIEATERLRTR